MLPRPSKAQPAAPRDIRELLPYRINRLATITERTGQARVSRLFGLNLSEWRMLGAIYALQPVTLAQLAGDLYLDKGQLSRTVSGLIDSGFVSHRPSKQDRRQTLFETTAEGRRLHDRMLSALAPRSRDLMGALSDREKAQFFRLLDKVTETSIRSYNELFSQGAKERGPKKRPARAVQADVKAVSKTAQATNKVDKIEKRALARRPLREITKRAKA